METIEELLAKNIRLRRIDKGWTQEKLAEEAGMHPVSINRIETLQRAAGKKAVGLIADALGCSPEDLYRSPDNRSTQPVSPDIIEAIERGAAQVLSSKVSSPAAEYEALSDDKRELIALIPRLEDGLVRQILGMLDEYRANDSESTRRRRHTR